MTDLICLKEVEEPYEFHATLFISSDFSQSRYCVIAEDSFIIFPNCNECISLNRIPLSQDTKVSFEGKELSISLEQFDFKFYHQEDCVILKCGTCLQDGIKRNGLSNEGEVFEEEVTIEKIYEESCIIFINTLECKLFIFESKDHQQSYLAKHAINLRFYLTKNIELQTTCKTQIFVPSSTLIIRGFRDDLKVTFSSIEAAKKWKDILCLLIVQYQCCLQNLENRKLLQSNIASSNIDINLEPIFEDVYSVTYTNNERLYSFITSLYNNRLTIGQKDPISSSNENINVCTVYFNYITFVYWNSSKKSLMVQFSPSCNFFVIKKNQRSNNNPIIISELSIYDNGAESFSKFRSLLLGGLLPNETARPSSETTLFLWAEAKINEEVWSKTKCYVTRNQLILSYPISTKFDLTLSEGFKISEDKSSLVIKFSHHDVSINSTNNIKTQMLINCFNEASKIKFLTLTDERTINKLNQLIKFLIAHGLWSEGIFRKCGQLQKVDSLYKMILEGKENIIINVDEFSVYDVASCLKKCVSNLIECLIPEEIFYKFEHSCHSDDQKKCVYNLKNSLKLLKEANFKMIKYIIELMFMIVRMGEFNQMDSENISISTATTVISKDLEKMKDSTKIMKCLIDNLFTIFDYSDEEQRSLLVFFETLKNRPQTTVLRIFYFKPTLKPHLITNNCQIIEEVKLKMEKEEAFLSISLSINNGKIVNHLYESLFQESIHKRTDLWHFLSFKKQWFKRLLYPNDNLNQTILSEVNFTSKLAVGENQNLFIFMPKETEKEATPTKTPYRCSAIVNNISVNMTLSPSNSLSISGEPFRNLHLSDLQVYRSVSAKATKIYILHSDYEPLLCKFECSDDYYLFLFFFDGLRQSKET